ncbi:hypothetical protein [Longispora albida]|uniref:hypothetical protein n=1 Tax=Longispora albida TaxID=203523 RepID=UPI000367FB73|nr:hypothetical protein [Longispora albida]
MGRDVQQREFTHEDRQRYRQKVRRCLDVFALMLDELRFDSDHPLTGLEIELNIVDGAAAPAMKNAEILTYMASPLLQTELGQFNLEINVPPRLIGADGLSAYENGLKTTLAQLGDRAAKADAGIALIGILPTLGPEHMIEDNLSANPRYRLLNSQIMAERGEYMEIDIRGAERFSADMDSIAPEAACTSIQFHLQVSPEQFPAYWNASQAIVAAQIAVGANSPFAFGKRLWSETRIALFTQATDVRPEELKVQGVRPRVWFGERWITSIFDLFEENVRYFPPLLPLLDDEDPLEVLRGGGVPTLGELRLHNGTVYRWNRPVYDVMGGRPHLRVENRVLPAGPTVVDMMANAAFYYGLVRALAEEDRPVWTKLPFTAAEANFYSAARRGIDAVGQWPGESELKFTDLILDRLLPLAYEGLDRFGVEPEIRDRLLGIIERRCALRRTGATWQTVMVAKLEKSGLTRPDALREMLVRYRRHSVTNAPVHTWPLD